MIVPVVIDNGSRTCKAGFAGQEDPLLVFLNCIGRLRVELETLKPFYIGEEALSKRGILRMAFPGQLGLISNWQAMEEIWHHIFKELNVIVKEHPIMLTEPPSNSIENRKQTAEIMFEKFDAPSLHLAISSVMALYGSGRRTGTVLDSGHGLTHTICVYDGNPLPNTINQMYLAGQDITYHLRELVREDERHYFVTNAETETVRKVEEKFCYIARDYNKQF